MEERDDLPHMNHSFHSRTAALSISCSYRCCTACMPEESGGAGENWSRDEEVARSTVLAVWIPFRLLSSCHVVSPAFNMVCLYLLCYGLQDSTSSGCPSPNEAVQLGVIDHADVVRCLPEASRFHPKHPSSATSRLIPALLRHNRAKINCNDIR